MPVKEGNFFSTLCGYRWDWYTLMKREWRVKQFESSEFHTLNALIQQFEKIVWLDPLLCDDTFTSECDALKMDMACLVVHPKKWYKGNTHVRNDSFNYDSIQLGKLTSRNTQGEELSFFVTKSCRRKRTVLHEWHRKFIRIRPGVKSNTPTKSSSIPGGQKKRERTRRETLAGIWLAVSVTSWFRLPLQSRKVKDLCRDTVSYFFTKKMPISFPEYRITIGLRHPLRATPKTCSSDTL